VRDRPRPCRRCRGAQRSRIRRTDTGSEGHLLSHGSRAARRLRSRLTKTNRISAGLRGRSLLRRLTGRFRVRVQAGEPLSNEHDITTVRHRPISLRTSTGEVEPCAHLASEGDECNAQQDSARSKQRAQEVRFGHLDRDPRPQQSRNTTALSRANPPRHRLESPSGMDETPRLQAKPSGGLRPGLFPWLY
jgi:hypothetical protein